jgi:perosamine synthetase
MVPSIPLFKIAWDEDDIASVNSVIKRGTSWANGPEIESFEQKIAEYIDVKYSVTFNSGTSALHALLLAHGVGSGDEVIVPSFTFIATANSCGFVGAKPIFADIEPELFGLDPDSVNEKITPKTKAIMPIHYGGFPCRIRELREIADDNGLLLIEDNAESLGAQVGGKQAGTFGDSAILSFCQNKIISTGEGGAAVTDSKDVYSKLRLIRSHGRVEDGDYFSTWKNFDYVSLGYNFRMPSIVAGLGISQLKKIQEIITSRRRIAESYGKSLSRIKTIKVPKHHNDYHEVYQMYTIEVPEQHRNPLMDYLSAKGIASKIYFSPVHLTPYYQEVFGHAPGELPKTEEISKRVVSIPMYPTLKDSEVQFISEAISAYFKVDEHE